MIKNCVNCEAEFEVEEKDAEWKNLCLDCWKAQNPKPKKEPKQPKQQTLKPIVDHTHILQDEHLEIQKQLMSIEALLIDLKDFFIDQKVK